ncbi:PucR family transcriptional regulator [Amycolatopsis sp. CA-126428]|uniref:PucR family transcriptional regulator n=1 Tax=Amycolatopsis sp. CA-126428 TaxID=2073158 RepID=UPI000CD32634|nr:helix-turn-helix domain-containing protein [Amycolatopsis sp. CA-126428]
MSGLKGKQSSRSGPATAALTSLVGGLRPTGDISAPPDEETEGSAVRAWAAEVAEATAAMTADADADLPDLPLAQIRRAAEDMLLRIMEELSGGATDIRLSVAQDEMARYSAARDIPFERMVAGLRLAQSYWADLLLAEVGRTGHWEIAPAVVKAVTRQVDAVVNASVRAYLSERERLLTSAAARRGDLVDALLAGHPVDSAECRIHLGVELEHQHLAMIIRDVSAVHSTAMGTELLRTADRAARAVGAATSLLHQPSPDTVWLWASHPRVLSADELTGQEAAVRRLGQRLAAGSPRAGAAGLRHSHRDALAADRMPLPHDGGSAVVRYRDVDLSALLGADLERARWFVRDHLGGLADAVADMEELRKTLTHYYRANMSLVAAAAPLHVHRNTVVYRLRRVEQILGHPVTERSLEVRCALLLVERFGAGVLTEGD